VVLFIRIGVIVGIVHYHGGMKMLKDVIVRGHFGNALRARRERLGYTQVAIAAIAGVNQGAIAKWEGRALPPKNPGGLLALAAFFKVSIEDLMAGAIPATWLGIDSIERIGEPPTQEQEEAETMGALERKLGWPEGGLSRLIGILNGLPSNGRERILDQMHIFVEGYRAGLSSINSHE